MGIRKENITPIQKIEAKWTRGVTGRISVIFPVREETISIDSLVSSLAPDCCIDLEIVFVLDGIQEQDAIEILEERVRDMQHIYSDRTIVWTVSRFDSSLTTARNAGLMRSTGEFICFLENATFLPGQLKKGMEYLRGSGTEIGAVRYGCRVDESSDSEENFYCCHTDFAPELLLEHLKGSIPPCISCIVFKRDAVMDLNGFDESYRYYSESDFLLRFSERYRMDIIDEAIAVIASGASEIDKQPDKLSLFRERGRLLGRHFPILEGILHDKQVLASQYEALLNQSREQIRVIDALNREIYALNVHRSQSFLKRALRTMEAIPFLQAPIERARELKKRILVHTD
jgi:glycosyltransferase involved in cell wall biosynthesis